MYSCVLLNSHWIKGPWVSPSLQELHKQGREGSENQGEIQPSLPQSHLGQKTPLNVLERQENQILPGKSGFCDGIQVWLFHFHFTFQRKQKVGQTTATGFISLVTPVKESLSIGSISQES